MQQVQLIGNLGQDVKEDQVKGQPIFRLSVATAEKSRDDKGQPIESTTWWNVSAWRLSEGLKPFLTKGKRVFVEGTLKPRLYQSGNGQWQISLEVTMTKLELC